MKKKRYKAKTSNNNKASEPKAVYGKRITFFKSFEEMNEFDQRYYASMTPQERLNSVFQMRNAFAANDNPGKPFGTRIHFEE